MSSARGAQLRVRLGEKGRPLSLAQQFMLASLGILMAAMLGVGWWVGQEIEEGVVNRTAATTVLYLDSFISPQIQELWERDSLAPEQLATLGRLLRDTPLGQQIVAFKLWNREGRVLFSTGPSTPGLTFPVHGGLTRAWQGEVAARISDLEDEENVGERGRWSHLLEIYSPVRLEGSNRIIAVAEFYQIADELDREVAAARTRSWLVVALATLATYLLLAGIVRRGSDTIERQQAELSDRLRRVTGLLEQNEDLSERVRRSANRATELNEQFLRRISAELHDGPAQDLSLSILRLDSALTRMANCPGSCALQPGGEQGEDLERIQFSLSRALQDLRSLATGLRLPELEKLTLAETVGRVVRAHERRTASRVTVNLGELPEQLATPVKITLYRLIQEGLSNAYRHGGGVEQQVQVVCEGSHIHVEISDRGPGFDWEQLPRGGGHLGLISMRERVEGLGGLFRVETEPGRGTRVTAVLPSAARM